jgi:hypothetical protein
MLRVGAFLTRNVPSPISQGPNNSTYSRTIAPRLHSMNFVRRDKPQSSIHYPPAGAIFVTAPGTSPVAKYVRSEPRSPRSPSTNFEITYKNATSGQTRSMTPSAGLLIVQPVLDSLTVSGHSWSNLVMAGYPSAYARDDAAARLSFARNATKSRLFPICTATKFVNHGVNGF